MILREDWLINPRYIYRGLDKKKIKKKNKYVLLEAKFMKKLKGVINI
jgi:hypothetical protein